MSEYKLKILIYSSVNYSRMKVALMVPRRFFGFQFGWTQVESDWYSSDDTDEFIESELIKKIRRWPSIRSKIFG